jgi:IclR family KDG regulon transcriptional repressor
MRLVRRTLRVLEILSEHSEGLGVTQLGALVGEPASSVHRLLSVLVDSGYVIQDQARRYRLGPRVLSLSRAFERSNDLVGVVRPHIARLSAQTLESVFVSEQSGDDPICVAAQVSPRPVSLNMRLGERTPYHASASARAILAFQPYERQVRLMQAERLERYTDRTPTTVVDALAELRATADRGYAFCDQERELGVSAISAPVRGADGEVFASVTIIAPQDRLIGEERERVAQQLLAKAADISSELGYRPVPAGQTRHGSLAVSGSPV